VCMDEEGVVPGGIRRLIELKELYDELGKKTGEELYEYRKSAVKWILVASFGYLGYRNSLFGSVMAYELVTSTSRELMRRARLVVEEKGYRVIHAIVDSVFIQGVASPEECTRVKELIEEATGFKAKVEAHYTWLYLPRDVKGLKGVANRYYGLLSSGELKAKGIMMVRGDTPILVKKAQYEALLELSKAVRPAEMASRLARAYAIIDSYIEKLRKGVFNVLDLVTLRNAREGYVKPPAYVFEGEPPYRLVYVSGKLRYLEKVKSLMIDVNKYIELLERARRELPSKKDVEALTASGE
jgi:DNA polymerase elongation subunit (family B)